MRSGQAARPTGAVVEPLFFHGIFPRPTTLFLRDRPQAKTCPGNEIGTISRVEFPT